MLKEFEELVSESGFKFSPEQQNAIYSEKNAVVSAGAGSGKTTVLSFRFLRLILSGIPIERILALTFTRKAALEMRDRIYRLLKKYASKNAKIRTAYENFALSSITTLDAFSSEIVKTSLKDYGIPESFSVIDDITNDENIRNLTLDCLYEDKENAEPFFTLYNPEDLIDNLLLQIVSSSSFTITNNFKAEDQLKILDEYKIAETADYFASQVIEAGDRMYDAMIADPNVEKYVGEFPDWYDCIMALATGGTFQTAYENKDYKAALACFKYLKKMNLRSDLKVGDLPRDQKELVKKIKGFATKLKGSSSYTEDFIKEFGKDIFLKDKTTHFLLTLEALPKIGKMLKFLEGYYNRVCRYKRENALLTFSDVASLSKDVLLRNGEVREFYKAKFDSIMIDEFQDNNILQKEMLYLLSEKKGIYTEGKAPNAENIENGKLFFVGDQKQSIYRFRGADVSVFKSLSDELKNAGGESIVLNANFRSRGKLVDFSNLLFESIMGVYNKEAYEADFEKTISCRNVSSYSIDGKVLPTNIEFYYIDKKTDKNTDSEVSDKDTKEENSEDDVNKKASEAAKIKDLILNVVHSDKYAILKDGKLIHPSFDDIAVIFRTRGSLLNLEKVLSDAHIPYTSSTSKSMFSSTIVSDIYSILSLLLYPSLKTSLYAVLRSPYCRLSDKGAMKVLSYSGNFPFENVNFESKEDENRYLTFVKYYRTLQELAKEGDISDVLMFIWYDIGARLYTIENPNTAHETKYFDSLLLAASEKSSLLEFVRYLDTAINTDGKNALNLPFLKEGEKGVSLLTIHESKGLEFPVVIMAFSGASKSNKTRKKFEEVYSDDGVYRLLPDHAKAEKFSNIIRVVNKDEESLKENAELKRLFYVGVTRAKDHLIISGDYYDPSAGKEKNTNDKFGSILQMFVSHKKVLGDALPITHEGQTEEISSSSIYLPQFNYNSLEAKNLDNVYNTDGIKKMEKTPETRGSITGVIQETIFDNPENLPPLSVDKATNNNAITEFGTLTHFLIERYVKHRIAPSEKYNACYIYRNLNNDMIAEAVHLATGFVNSELFLSFKNEGYTLYSEYRFFAPFVIDGTDMTLEGSIDLLAVKDDKAVVVDFKTDKKKAPSSHKEQLSLYKDAVKQLFGIDDIETEVVYLREFL